MIWNLDACLFNLLLDEMHNFIQKTLYIKGETLYFAMIFTLRDFEPCCIGFYLYPRLSVEDQGTSASGKARDFRLYQQVILFYQNLSQSLSLSPMMILN